MLEKDRGARRNDYGLKQKTSLLMYFLHYYSEKLLRIYITELYYITGGSARGKKVKPKTWRISPFADAIMTPLVLVDHEVYH